MSDKSSTIPIMFHAGTYGTYLDWCLTTLCANGQIEPPFTKNGNSHGFKGGNHIGNMDAWQEYCLTGQPTQFVRFHPKTKKEENLSKNLDSIMASVNRAIYIYPDTESVLLTINNYYHKIYEDWWSYKFNNDKISFDQETIYNNWPVSRSVGIAQIPTWIKREFLSYYLMPSWHSQVDWYQLDYWNHPNCCIVLVKDLLHNFASTLGRIGSFCQLDFKKSISDLLPFHDQNLKLQTFTSQDKICLEIVQATVAAQYKQWDTLPLPSEMWIQWQLRNLGYEIQCHELDIFPTNSVKLRELLYPA